MAERYPLHWPAGWPRTPQHRRADATYQVTFNRALEDALDSIRKMGGRSPIVSSNLKLRQDGLPYANQREPDDSGIAVYWTQDGQQRVIACDCWRSRRDNMRAIGLTLEGLRAIQRSGASSILDRAFAGFAALPAAASGPDWRAVLGLGPTANADDVKRAFRGLAREHHPDHGGDPDRFRRLVEARDAAEMELRGAGHA